MYGKRITFSDSRLTSSLLNDLGVLIGQRHVDPFDGGPKLCGQVHLELVGAQEIVDPVQHAERGVLPDGGLVVAAVGDL